MFALYGTIWGSDFWLHFLFDESRELVWATETTKQVYMYELKDGEHLLEEKGFLRTEGSPVSSPPFKSDKKEDSSLSLYERRRYLSAVCCQHASLVS